jgi:hypothetical protein
MGEWGAFVALLVLTPNVAGAHGEQVLFLFLYFPFLVVLAALVIGIWTWEASRDAKARTFLAVAATTLVIFALNYYCEGLAVVAPLGGAAFLIGLTVQFGIPALVWWFCRRREDRRAEEQ